MFGKCFYSSNLLLFSCVEEIGVDGAIIDHVQEHDLE